jgi:hypothetical protein
MNLLNMHRIANRLLERDPDPVVQYRLMRDVLTVPRNDDAYLAVRLRRSENRWIRELGDAQHHDGSWGRFHTRDTAADQRIPTTEQGVYEAVALGLEPTDDLLRRAGGHMVGILTGAVSVPDYAEQTPFWAAMMRFFVGGTMALFDPYIPVLDRVMADARVLLEETFSTGSYDAEDEAQAWQSIVDTSETGRYLSLSTRYFLELFGPHVDELPLPLEDAYANWLWRRKGGVGYLGVPLMQPPDPESPTLGRWLLSLDLMSPFPSSRAFVQEPLAWLWEHRNSNGLWDFGPRTGDKDFFQLSSSWREAHARENDHSTRALLALSRYVER